MNAEDRKLVGLIREALPPLGEPTGSIDLWPRFEHRLSGPRTKIAKIDWLMAALMLGLLVSFPEVVLLVLYHL